jgi:ATP-dependent helicase/nuclease subunit A
MNLSQAQLDAIRRSGQDVCVVAGPGSGKTTVLIERFAWLVEEQHVDASRILAITFTEKAATEIKERLIKRFRERFEADVELRESIERAWVSTIHGFCARLLRENAIAAGLSPDFTVLDQPSAERMAREAAEESLDLMFRERPADMRCLLESLDLSTDDYQRKPDLARSLLDVYESMRESGLRELPEAAEVDDVWPRAQALASEILGDRNASGKDLPKLKDFVTRLIRLPGVVDSLHLEVLDSMSFSLGSIGKNCRARQAADELKNEVVPLLKQQWVASLHADSASLLREAMTRIDELYRRKKRDESAIDFAGLEEETIRLLESDAELRTRTAARFDQILMDELQDTNRLQWRLVNLIRRSFFAVGDINQSIYSFRYADPAVFSEYRDALVAAGAHVDDLRENHRSVSEVLDAVSQVLDGQSGIEHRPLIASRGPSNENGGNSPVDVLVARGDEDTVDREEVEASMVAARIRELCADGTSLKDIAILVRTLGAAKPFERALDQLGIPFVVSGGRTFLEAREIRDVLALLAVLVNPLDDVAMIGVLRSPLVGMSDEEIFRIGHAGWLAEFDRHFGELRPMAGFVAPDQLLASALDECGYAAMLTDRARANVEKLFAYIRREHSRAPRPLAELLDDLEALRATQSEAEAPPPEAGDVVRVMTIHAAKGLEFPIVFICAMHRQTDQTRPVIAFSPGAGLGAKWRNPVTGEGQSDRAHKRIVEEMKLRESAEENRLLYVAMTRAENRLILSYAEKKRGSNWPKLIAKSLTPTSVVEHVITTATELASAAMTANADQLVDPPTPISRRDAAASVTSVAQFHACPRKYLLSTIRGSERVAKVDGEAAGGEAGGMEFGTAVHGILAGESIDDAEATELASRFHASDLGRRAARADRIEREFDFLFYFEDIVLRGQIDLWFEEDGELIVIDYKTDREQSPDAYALQLQIYALALERYAGRVADRAVLYYLRPDVMVEVAIDAEAARAAVRTFLNAQDTLEYPMKAGTQCYRCAFFGNGCVGIGTTVAVG